MQETQAMDEREARYREEAEKRLTHGERSYRSLRDLNVDFDADPFTDRVERDPIVEETDVVIVGAGWAGMTTTAFLAKQGVTDYRVIDKAGDFGGTWYWNRYPGCMCDVESYTYLPLLEEVGYMPTKKYAHATEIFHYAQLLARHFDMYPHSLFHTEVTGMRWVEAGSRWLVATSRADQLSARFVVICGGVLHKAKLPGIPGIERFQGRSFHTSRWDYGYTGGSPDDPTMDKLADKVVGIIGTGATAVQAVPRVAEAAKHLYVFQRTPSSVSPRNQRDTDPEWFREMSSKPGWHEERMANFVEITTGLNPPVDLVQDGWTEMFKVDVKKEPRDEHEAAELRALDFRLMDAIRQRISDTVKDPATAQALKPWYGVSCKRPCYHDEYLPAFNRDNVTLVDTDGLGVERITERGVVAAGREYSLDCIIYATGFDSPATFYTHRLGFDPVGKDGVLLSESWSHGAYTLHGIWTHGFPNLCMNSHIQGGQHINIAYAATKNAEHTAWVIRQALDQGVTVEPDIDAEEEWFQFVAGTVGAYAAYFATCTPGYLNNEGQVPQERDMRSVTYMRSATELRDLFAQWRATGDMRGLNKAPVDR
ncbi:MAG TPA: NAD(P)/FAD-dependent oxidoreductase [Acidimicrobiales bacterium]|nr:NAD(P)/FAD-dependent oxidoreductase [Acidimicrobiales bacterium]